MGEKALAAGEKALAAGDDAAKLLKEGDDLGRTLDEVWPPPKLEGGNPLPTKGMNPHYQGENVPGNSVWPYGQAVHYLDDAGRESYRVIPRDGKLLDVTGKPFDTAGAVTHWSGDGKAIYVMDEQGNIYASNYQEVAKFHHSSLLGGKPVSAAGELEVRNGEVIGLTDQSGHYLPTRSMTQQMVQRLRDAGIPIRDDQVTMIAPN